MADGWAAVGREAAGKQKVASTVAPVSGQSWQETLTQGWPWSKKDGTKQLPKEESSCGLATDLILRRRGVMPPVIYIPLTEALFTQDFAFHSRGRPVGLESNEQLAHHFLFPTLPGL